MVLFKLTNLNYHFNQLPLIIGLSLFFISSNVLKAENTSFLYNNIQFKNPSYKSYGQGNEGIALKSEKGYINLNNLDVHLIGNVEAKFKLDGETYSIKSDSLTSNLLDKSISSKEKTLFESNVIEVVASSMEITKIQEETAKISFKNANFNKINPGSKVGNGKANMIELILEKDLIMMKGNAELYEDEMKIISDEIHYDLGQDRILKSINAKIINNL